MRASILLLAVALTGCSSLKPIPESDKAGFYNQSTNPSNATLFLTCGKLFAANGTETTSPGCTYMVNGVKYKRLGSNQVARLEVPGGKVSVENSEGQDPPKEIQVPAGTMALLVTDTAPLDPSRTAGAAFGLIGGIAQAIYNANNPDENLNAPLRIFNGNNIKVQMVGMVPVQLEKGK